MVKKNAFVKEILREIRHTAERFIGIFAIVTLGVCVFAGLGSTGTFMKSLGNDYFTAQSFMDIRVLSTFGLTDRDLAAIREVDGISTVIPGYIVDAMATSRTDSAVLKIHSLPESEQAVNKPRLTAGRMPQKPGEAVAEERLLQLLGLEIGDKIHLQSGKNSDIRLQLRSNTYTVTGTVEYPVYFTTDRGTSTIGNGKVDAYLLLPEENFLSSVYSEALVLLQKPDDIYFYGASYKTQVQLALDEIEAVGDLRAPQRKQELTGTAWAKIDAAQKELQKSRALLQTGLHQAGAELQSGETESFHGSLELSARSMELDAALLELEANEQALIQGLSEIDAGMESIASGEAQLLASLLELQEAQGLLDSNEVQLQAQKKLLLQSISALEQLGTLPPEQQARYEQLLAGLAQLRAGELQLDTSRMEAESGIMQVNLGMQQLQLLSQELEVQRQELLLNMGELQAASLELAQAQRLLEEKEQELASADAQLRTGRIAYHKQRTDAMDELAQGQRALDAQKQQLYDLKEPKWYVLDRGKNVGYESYAQDADKIHAIGKTIPLVFFLVAAFISLTTMTRFVEERRTELGTLKSLGYKNGMILSKYLIYAFVPTFLGSLIGGWIGMILFPRVIVNAYGNMYAFPPFETQMHYGYWALGLLLAVCSTGLTTAFVAIRELGSVPAQLMRPKAPKAGGRTVLERIPALWSRLGFTHKVTLRNIMRFKKRFVMTVIGVGGCTALLLMGFGIRDSVSGIVANQYGEIFKYNVTTSFTENASQSQVDAGERFAQGAGAIQSTLQVREKRMNAENSSGTRKDINLVVIKEPERAGEFFNFRQRVGHQALTLGDEGVIISEKLSILLGLSVGDAILISEEGDNAISAPITGICETYFMHSVYLTSALYKALTGEQAEYNTLYSILAPNADAASIAAFSGGILDYKGVSSVTFVEDSTATADAMLKSLDIVIVVIILLAGALAFVVLLNLTNINITERMRELATLEVLGFRDREVSSYVYRENIIVSLAGAGAGLILGRILHMYIILSVEPDEIMFSRAIGPLSFLIAAAITMVFTVCVNYLTSARLRSINMVEALKSVE